MSMSKSKATTRGTLLPKRKWAGTHAFWACDQWLPCPRCGALFHRTNVAQKYCGCKRTKLETTLEQSLIVQRYRNLLRKYNLHKKQTFHMITGAPGQDFNYLTDPARQFLSAERRKRWCQLLEKFCNDFENGRYEIVQRYRKGGLPTCCVAIPLLVPRKKHCPMNVSQCPGAVFSCVRGWKECSFEK